MQKIIVSAAGAAILFGASALVSARAAAPRVQGTSTSAAPPDFSGVYYPAPQGRGGGRHREQTGAEDGAGQRGGDDRAHDSPVTERTVDWRERCRRLW